MSPFGFLTSCQSKKTMFFFLPKTLGQILKVLLERSIAKQAIQHRFPADEKRLADFSRESWDAPWKKRGRTRVHEERSSRSKDFRRPIYGRVSEMMPSSKARAAQMASAVFACRVSSSRLLICETESWLLKWTKASPSTCNWSSWRSLCTCELWKCTNDWRYSLSAVLA